LYLMGLGGLDINSLTKKTLFSHLYRVQKLSSCYYEFRLAYKQINHHTGYPEHIRINNFNKRKTGWMTHQPRKVKISLTGQLKLIHMS
ncbi:MAG: hypothetical protein ACPH19_01665, partial [Flavobacteriaceae bacterium]